MTTRSPEPTSNPSSDPPVDHKEKNIPEKPKVGIYLLPNLFTTACLFAGFYAIVAAKAGHFETAAVAIFIAMIMDGLDGRIARMTQTQSAFGAEYDSLADMVSFGLAPALVTYEWTLHGLGKIGWLAAFVFTAAVALRLARFNSQAQSNDKKFFKGLPSPAGAAVLASLVWVGDDFRIPGEYSVYAALLLCVVVALLMVSNIHYYSFKEFDLRNRVSFVTALLIVLVFVLISSSPPQIIFVSMVLYAASGLFMTCRKRYRKKNLDGEAD
ncbi:MAG: CDP-diacylglycerol--serine O-phosphatidyltransferase [Gammaproteobacteria bacterium]|nr:MAG: CDP-diacylglycerol--serine O-phosphatidyltransferase [Gammaproteobacteria bacterium]